MERMDGDSALDLKPGGLTAERHRLDAFTHARLWRNPCGFAARFNYLALRYNQPLTVGWRSASASPASSSW